MKRTLIFCSTLSLAACGAFRDSTDKVGDTLELQGSYQTEAKEELSIRANGIGCIVQTLDVEAADMTIRQSAFEKSDCSGDPLGELVTTGSFSLGDELPIAPGARALDFTVSKVTLTPHSKDWLEVLGIDGSGDCKVGDIPVNETREVTGLTCGALGKIPAHDAIFFTSILISNNEAKFTKLPNELPDNVGTKERPAARAEELNVVYHRK